MQNQLKVMLELQNAMNARVHIEWREQGFEWYRAIWIESAELMDHYGWKWWKHQKPDVEQVKLELIDIFHFGLSILLVNQTSIESIAEQLTDALNDDGPEDFKTALETFTIHTLHKKDFSVSLFVQLLKGMEMTFEDLYSGYVGKNVLNFFRQDHGYKEGTYKKIWAGREDNEHLVELVAELDVSDAQFSAKLYQSLKTRYETDIS
ncbi:MAG: dimeric dUTPase (all-alpha-NTP-PPase superfamily) [Pseudohongiellaceae bacterium]